MADEFRGGRQAARDRWFGLKERRGFDDFRRWWHRQGKRQLSGGQDLANRNQAEEAWTYWHLAGRPVMK